MNIFVCLKQVRESSDSGAARILNPSDACALEAALRLRECGDRVTVVSMGPDSVEQMLREAIARGADDAVQISAPALAGSDTLATARVLAAAARKLGPFDMILAGRRAVDGETSLTPFRMASLLDIPCVTDVCMLDRNGLCQSETSQAVQTLKADLPAVFCLREGSYPLRLMGILGMRRAKSAVIRRLSLNDLELDASLCGLAGSPTRVTRVFPLPAGKRHPVFLKSASELLRILREARIHPPRQTRIPSSSLQKLRGSVWVICNAPDPPLIARASALSGGSTTCLYTEGDGQKALAAGADRAILLDVPPAMHLDGGILAREITALLAQAAPDAVLFSSTPCMRDIASRIATELRTGLTADCTALEATKDGLLSQIRPTWGGAQLAEILCPDARPQMALVRPGAFDPPVLRDTDRMPERMVLRPAPSRIALLSSTSLPSDSPVGADVILAGGRGLAKEDFLRLRRLAETLHARVGASRGAVDLGYAPYSCQIGQTGHTVCPAVYVAIGISGAVQHILGMHRSGVIAAVNNDPKSPIFDYADYALVGDGGEIIQKMEEELS